MNLRGKPAPLWGVLSSSKRKPSLTMLFLIFFRRIVPRSFDAAKMIHGICNRKAMGDSVECQYNLAIKYELYKSRKRAGRSPGRPKGGHAGRSGRRLRRSRRGLRSGSLAWHKARGGVGELPFPKLAPCTNLARWMRTFGKRCWPAEWQRAEDLSKRV